MLVSSQGDIPSHVKDSLSVPCPQVSHVPAAPEAGVPLASRLIETYFLSLSEAGAGPNVYKPRREAQMEMMDHRQGGSGT